MSSSHNPTGIPTTSSTNPRPIGESKTAANDRPSTETTQTSTTSMKNDHSSTKATQGSTSSSFPEQDFATSSYRGAHASADDSNEERSSWALQKWEGQSSKEDPWNAMKNQKTQGNH